ncbi:dihydrodipicolinate reductase C-terminal domain-containing protein [Streptomyces flaveolus]|uniref:4-hydroxy-tetrahydrodipicolinate reductase n=1 Tax=Streptomyces flaveolus TaxID=67297 RepID=UPI0034413D02
MSIPVVVCGRGGRMSRLLSAAVAVEPGLTLAARLTTPARAADGSAPPHGPRAPLITELAGRGSPSVVVDFTHRAFTASVLTQAAAAPCSLVIGTSGLSDGDRALMAEAARERAVVCAANFSVSAHAVARFVRDLARQTGPEWDAGVLDVHFAAKKDAPSATARLLAEQWRRPAAETTAAPVVSLRLGDAVSEHRVIAEGPGEHVEIVHRVSDRAAFLPGILQAVRFAATAPAGLYTMEDVACTPSP